MKPFHELTKQGKIRRYHQLARLALQAYPLTVVNLRCISIRHNIIFRVQTPDDILMLRIGYPTIRNRLMVESEMRWLSDMAHSGIDLRINTPVATRDGQWVQTCQIDSIPHKHEIVLMTWLKGQSLQTIQTEETLYLLGAATAKLHNFAASYSPQQPFMTFDMYDIDEWGSIDYLSDDSILNATQQDLFQNAIERTTERLKSWRIRDGVMLIHADLHLKNAVIYEGKLGIFDFDDCRWGHNLQDLGVMLANLRDKAPPIQALRTAYLNGYATERSLLYSDDDLMIATVHRLMMMLTFVVNLRPQFRASTITDIDLWLRQNL